MTRRSFFTKVLVALGGVTTLAFLLPVIKYLIPQSDKGRLNIFENEIGEAVLASSIKDGDSVLGLSDEGATIVLRREGKLFAISAVCTHLGCIVKWQPSDGTFFCPCHAGKFDANGANISGPPPAPLATYNVTVSDTEHIILNKRV